MARVGVIWGAKFGFTRPKGSPSCFHGMSCIYDGRKKAFFEGNSIVDTRLGTLASLLALRGTPLPLKNGIIAIFGPLPLLTRSQYTDCDVRIRRPLIRRWKALRCHIKLVSALHYRQGFPTPYQRPSDSQSVSSNGKGPCEDCDETSCK